MIKQIDDRIYMMWNYVGVLIITILIIMEFG